MEELLDLSEVVVDPSCAMQVPYDFAFACKVLPLSVVNGDMIVAMADPTDVRTIAELRRGLGVPVLARGVDPAELEKLLRQWMREENDQQ